VHLAAIAAALIGLGVATYTGYATNYRVGLMTEVAARRGLAPAACMVALDDTPLGSFVRVVGIRTGERRRCKVVDLSAPQDRAQHQRMHLIELDFASAQAVCGHVGEPRRACPVVWSAE
jgi:hypothetical protein